MRNFISLVILFIISVLMVGFVVNVGMLSIVGPSNEAAPTKSAAILIGSILLTRYLYRRTQAETAT